MSRSSLSAGLATFNSCNKAGSIPHFTKHLKSNPGDYTALMWRGRAFSIINDQQNAIRDFGSASAVSSGPRKCIAQYFEASSRQDAQKSVQILGDALRVYPNSYEVVGEVGCLLHMSKDYTNALPFLEKSISLMESAGPVNDPSYCWIKHDIGIIYLEQKNLTAAEGAFAAALNFSETHTVSHVGYARVKLAKGEESSARRHYDRARALNPTLVTWTTFESFKEAVQPESWFDKLKNLPWTMANMFIGTSTESIGSARAVGTTSAQARPAQRQSASANQSNWQTSNSSRNQTTTGASNASSAPRTPVTVNRSSSSSFRASGSAISVTRPSSARANRPSAITDTTKRPVSATSASTRPSSAKSSGTNSQTSQPSISHHSSNSTLRQSSASAKEISANDSTYHPRNRSSYGTVKTQGSTRPYTSSKLSTVTGDNQKTVFSELSGLTWKKTPEGWVQVDIDASRKSKKTQSSHKSGVSKTSSTTMGGHNIGSGHGRGGNGGDGGGSGSDDEDDHSNEKWKKMKKESREILKHGGKEYVLSRDEKHYFSRDKAGHGTAYLKVYSNKKNRLDFIGSLDWNMKFMEGKHESREGTSIRKSDMDVVRRK